MTIQRFYIANAELDLNLLPAGMRQIDGVKLGDRWLYRVIGEGWLHEAFAKLPNVIALPGLGTPTNRIPSQAIGIFMGRGITPEAGDALLNVLRAWRDREGENARSFDISARD